MFAYFKPFYIAGERNVLKYVAASINGILSSQNSLRNDISNLYCRSQTFELCNISNNKYYIIIAVIIVTMQFILLIKTTPKSIYIDSDRTYCDINKISMRLVPI
jgi:hypothetical protein